jgi:hypothetical protein
MHIKYCGYFMFNNKKYRFEPIFLVYGHVIMWAKKMTWVNKTY